MLLHILLFHQVFEPTEVQRVLNMCVFFRGASGAFRIHFLMVSFIVCTCPNRTRVGAIDNPGLLKQVFEQYDVPEKNFEHDFLIVCSQKMFICSLSTAFISNFTHYNLY